MRILAVSILGDGADDYGLVRAFERAGHAVVVVSPEWFVPRAWRGLGLRALRRLITPLLVRDYNAALLDAAHSLQPELFFAFKGTYVAAATVSELKARGAVAINFDPDISFFDHGPWIPAAVPHYDWIFTTKTFGVRDLREKLGYTRASFLPHAFDPETHAPVRLSIFDRERFGCDITFIGTWSSKKERLLSHVARSLPQSRLRIWGADWHRAGGALKHVIEGQCAYGKEYAAAIQASKITLALLHEGSASASSGDLITSRTFQIPAVGGLMLHENTKEVVRYFEPGEECAVFDGEDDLIDKIRYYLAHDEERERIAVAGRKRSLASDYSVDASARKIVDKTEEISAGAIAAVA